MPEVPNYLDLYSAGLNTIETAGLELTDKAAQYFMTHARRAVARIQVGDIPDGVDPYESFRKLALEVVRIQSSSHYGQEGLKKASTDAIEIALAFICPLFPFCD